VRARRGTVQLRRLIPLGLAALCALVVLQPVFGGATGWTSQFGTSGFDAIYQLDVHQGDVSGVGEVEGALPGQTWAGSCDVVVRTYRGRGDEKWTRQFGTSGCDFAEGVAAARGSVYVGGTVEGALPGWISAGSWDGFVRRYDEDGNEVWTRQFGTEDFDGVFGAAADDDAVYVVGQVFGALPGQQSSGSWDAFVRKYDADGNELWTRQFGTAGSDAAHETDVDANGVVVVGRVFGALPGQQHAGARDVFVRKYDTRGNVLWTRQFGTAGSDTAWGVDVEGGSVYVSGDVAGALPGHSYAGGPLDAFVRRYDRHGSELWTRQFGTAGFDRAVRVAADATKVVAVGRVGGALPGRTFAGGATDPFVRVYDPAGNEVWTTQFGGTLEPEAATGVALDDEGDGIFVSGGVSGTLPGQTSQGYIDAFVMKLLVPGS
jgi:hypothetical protein